MEFKRGDRVKVVNTNLKTYGLIGTVSFVSGFKNYPNVQVNFGSITLTYKKRNLKLVSDFEIEDNTKSNKGDDSMLMGNYRVCKIKFVEGTNSSREYYYALYNYCVCVDDYVVVKSANHGMGIARVTDIILEEHVTQEMRDYCNEGREVINMFDMSAYEERVENRKKAKQLKADMEKKVKAMQELALYEMMAEKNPELKEMLETYKELIK